MIPHPNSSGCKSRTEKTYKRLSLFGNFKDSCPLKSHFLQSLCLSGKNVYELRLLLKLSDRSHVAIKVVMSREKSENSKEVIQLDFEVENKRSFTQKVAVI